MTFDFDGLVCDLDGVIYRGDEVIPGAPEAIEALRARGVRVVFCTNNSRATVAGYKDKLIKMGIPSKRDDVVTSAVVTGDVLAARGMAGRRALVVGGDGVREALTAAGLEIVDAGAIDVVVVGLDPSFDYASMDRAAAAIRGGATFIATNDDASLPEPDGLRPGAGAILASIEVASGRRAEVMGKPHPPMMEVVARRLAGCARIAVVGDRPETDLAGGAARNWSTILVTSGVTAPERAHYVRPTPDLILPSITALVDQSWWPKVR